MMIPMQNNVVYALLLSKKLYKVFELAQTSGINNKRTEKKTCNDFNSSGKELYS